MLLASAVVLLLLLLGCVVGPDFKRPDTPASDGYSRQTVPQDTARTDANPAGTSQRFASGKDIPGDWWTLFHSTSLNGLIERAFKANPDLAAAQAALHQAEESVAVTAGGYLPTMQGSLQATRQKENGAELGEPGFSLLYSLYNASVNVSYSPDVWGGVHRQVEAAAATADNMRFQLEATYLSLSANVVTAAIQEASLRGQIAATLEIIQDERRQVDILNSQFELGGAAKADVLAEQAQLAQVEATLPPLRKSVAQTRTQLTVYLGTPPNEEFSEEFTLDSLTLPEELPLSLPSTLVEQRPDIRQAEATLHQASANIGVAVANRLPNVTLTGSFGDASLTAGSVFTPASNVWSIGAGLTQPLIDEITLAHKEHVADAAFDQAVAQYRSTVLKAFEDVANTLHAIDADAVTLKAQIVAEETAAQSLSIAEQQYKIGAITYPTLLNAQKTDQQSRINVVEARAARFADTAALFQALGGGWWNRSDVQQQASADVSAKEVNAP